MTQKNAQSTSEQPISENDLIAQRHAKLKQIEEQAKQTGVSPWPNAFKRNIKLNTTCHILNHNE